MSTVYSWDLTAAPFSGSLPNPGPYVAQTPASKDARKRQFEKGMKFANVPSGRADFAVRDGQHVYHVNSIQNLYVGPISAETNFGDRSNGLSGAVRYRRFRLPNAVKKSETRNLDAFGNPIFPGTGT